MKKEFVFGIKPVEETIRSGAEIEKILVRKDNTNTAVKDLLTEASLLNIPVQKVPVEKLNKITRKNHQGLIAYISSISYASLDHIIERAFKTGKDPLLLVLDRITDVRNFGAIARTAEGLGFDAIIVPARGGALVNEEAMKTSAGALSHIAVSRVKNLAGTLYYLKNHGIKTVACTEKTGTVMFNEDLSGPLTLVLGSEYDGISENVIQECDLRVKIPMFGKIDSYNVSVSMAMIGSEIVRQRMS